ncbi:MAG: hypothetical protein M1823_000167 [Watsoniomyces obsoletus]|nr:MAG: hypothetical protein M1823_000167 [Watsoniomyces obsoletus]
MASSQFLTVPPRSFGGDFFIEEDEPVDQVNVIMNDRERIKQLARERQLTMADDMNDAVYRDYVDEIRDHLVNVERVTLPDVASMDLQEEIRWYMRPFLLDFLVEAHAAFQLRPQTLYLAINLVDRYCSYRVVYKRHFQLLGCAALLVASKFTDRKERVPSIPELQGLCCDMYDHSMFHQIEWHLLETVDWLLGHPTPDLFVAIAMGEMEDDDELENMTLYLCESALFHREFVGVLPSMLVRAALALSMELLGRHEVMQDDWARDYDMNICYNLAKRLGVTSAIVARKYASAEFCSVAVTVEAWIMQHGRPGMADADEDEMIMAGVIMDPMHHVPAHLTVHPPITPQKGSAPPNALGIITPPITPENVDDMVMEGQFDMPVDPNVYQTRPLTPTSALNYGLPTIQVNCYDDLLLGHA